MSRLRKDCSDTIRSAFAALGKLVPGGATGLARLGIEDDAEALTIEVWGRPPAWVGEDDAGLLALLSDDASRAFLAKLQRLDDVSDELSPGRQGDDDLLDPLEPDARQDRQRVRSGSLAME